MLVLEVHYEFPMSLALLLYLVFVRVTNLVLDKVNEENEDIILKLYTIQCI